MTMINRRILMTALGATALSSAAGRARAQGGVKKYDDGATDTEIKLGNTYPYSGNVSGYGVNGRTIEAVFKMVNDGGGVNGRKITFLTYDDGYSPPRTVEMTRKLVEEDKVLVWPDLAGGRYPRTRRRRPPSLQDSSGRGRCD